VCASEQTTFEVADILDPFIGYLRGHLNACAGAVDEQGEQVPIVIVPLSMGRRYFRAMTAETTWRSQ